MFEMTESDGRKPVFVYIYIGGTTCRWVTASFNVVTGIGNYGATV